MNHHLRADVAKRHQWAVEIALVLGFYLVYSIVRNQFGSAAVSATTAFRNAKRVIDIEEAMHLYVEPDIQAWFIDYTWFIQFWNLFYGTFHFFVTAGVLLYLYFRKPGDYPFWRTAGMVTTGLALIGFALFPLMPPRLLGHCGEFGACLADSPYIDTVADIGGLWSFDSGTAQKVTNQFAAMPSLHFGWALWSTLAMRRHVRNPITKFLNWSYPAFTLFAIIVTANHYWIDAVGGLIGLGMGLCVAWWFHGRHVESGDASTVSA